MMLLICHSCSCAISDGQTFYFDITGRITCNSCSDKQAYQYAKRWNETAYQRAMGVIKK